MDPDRGSYQNLVKKSKEAIKTLGIEVPIEKITFKEFHMTSKAGLYCQSLWSSLVEVTRDRFRTDIEPDVIEWPGIGLRIRNLIKGIEEGVDYRSVFPKEMHVSESTSIRR
jgi:hypothetical protein